ncbi:anthranilate synthase component I [Oligella ureolytica]
MQVQVGQVINKPFRDSPLSYRSLRSLNPSPFMYYYNFDAFHVVGSSPEILVRQEHVLNTEGEEETEVTFRPLPALALAARPLKRIKR